jgi:hypothetical protein
VVQVPIIKSKPLVEAVLLNTILLNKQFLIVEPVDAKIVLLALLEEVLKVKIQFSIMV